MMCPWILLYYLNAFFKRKQAEQMFENGIAIKKDMWYDNTNICLQMEDGRFWDLNRLKQILKERKGAEALDAH